jgi:TonB family protein
MRKHNLPLPVVLVAFVTLMLFDVPATVPKTSPVHSFFIVRHFFSDDLPSGYDEILSVTPQGRDVCVRLIRISLANRFCGAQLVRAAEHILPNTTVRKVTGGTDPCSYIEQQVEAALKASATKGAYDPSDSSIFNVVAHCGAQERVFAFPYPAEINEKAFQRDNPRINALWNLNYKVRSHAFGKQFSFYNLPPHKEKEFEELGTMLLPELVSGAFEAGFGGYTCGGRKCDTNYLAWRLKGYDGAPANRYPSVELINAAALQPAHYDLPHYPPLAAQTRISGEVRLQIFIDQTGLVKDVHLVSGHPLLGSAAMDAVKKWQFSPKTQSDQLVAAILKFSLCPDDR